MALNHRATESKKEENKNDLFLWVPFYHVSCGYSLTAKSAHQVLRLKRKKWRTQNELDACHHDSKKNQKTFSSVYEVSGAGSRKKEKKNQELKFPSAIPTLQWEEKTEHEKLRGAERGWPVPGWVVTSLVRPFPFLLLKGSTAGRTSPFPSCLDSVRLEIGGLFPQLLTVVTEFWI